MFVTSLPIFLMNFRISPILHRLFTPDRRITIQPTNPSVIVVKMKGVKEEGPTIAHGNEWLPMTSMSTLVLFRRMQRPPCRVFVETIKAVVPKAEEAIHYRIPTFKYRGPLVGFSASRNHCSLHLMSPHAMQANRIELCCSIRPQRPPASLSIGCCQFHWLQSWCWSERSRMRRGRKNER